MQRLQAGAGGHCFPSVAWKLLLAKDEKNIEIESKSLETFIAIWI